MEQKSTLTLKEVNLLLDAAQNEADKQGVKVSICIADDGGYPLGLRRLDGAAPSTQAIAQGKAHTAAWFRAPTGALEDKVGGRQAMTTIDGATLLRGGLPISSNGQVIGSIGVAGAAPDQDEAIATKALTALD